jgi:2-dehydropantoate 2-reductase
VRFVHEICGDRRGRDRRLRRAALVRGGAEVTLVARGPHLAAMRERGVRSRARAAIFEAHPSATDAIALDRAGRRGDLAVKAHQIEPIVDDLRTLYHDETAVIAMQNGIPWWYFALHGGAHDGYIVRSVDPDGKTRGGHRAASASWAA